MHDSEPQVVLPKPHTRTALARPPETLFDEKRRVIKFAVIKGVWQTHMSLPSRDPRRNRT